MSLLLVSDYVWSELLSNANVQKKHELLAVASDCLVIGDTIHMNEYHEGDTAQKLTCSQTDEGSGRSYILHFECGTYRNSSTIIVASGEEGLEFYVLHMNLLRFLHSNSLLSYLGSRHCKGVVFTLLATSVFFYS